MKLYKVDKYKYFVIFMDIRVNKMYFCMVEDQKLNNN